jgi:hypothetical protein
LIENALTPFAILGGEVQKQYDAEVVVTGG